MSKEQQINQSTYLQQQNRQAYLHYCQQIIAYVQILHWLRVLSLCEKSAIYSEKHTKGDKEISAKAYLIKQKIAKKIVSGDTYDKVGNRTGEIITGAAPNTKTYSYNQRDQLTQITDTLASTINYTYDNAGNQLTKDDNGTLTTFDYTARQRVKSITVGSGNPINYQYDYTGQRINYQTNGIEKRYLYDGLTLIAETNTIGNTIARYHYGDRYQLAEQRNSINSYYHVDSLGTNVAVTNQDGSIQARYEYDAYGNLLTESGSSETPFGFTGYQLDSDTGLYYANARYYDSETGRFNREDTLEGNTDNVPSLHRYMYAYANPNVFIDPDGKLGIFNDGTWNNNYDSDEAFYETSTNVTKLFNLYDGEKFYLKGVGTDWNTSIIGGSTGLGVQRRINESYNKITKILNENKHLAKSDPKAWQELISLDFLGFSRGSTQVVALTNMIAKYGIPDTDSGGDWDPDRRTYVYKNNIQGVNMRFLGTFDTVAAVGNPFNGSNGLDLTINTKKVAQTSHAIMMHDNRNAFDVIAFDDIEKPQFSNIKQRIFPGVHSNGGGGIGLVQDDYWYFRIESFALPGGVSMPLPQLTRETRLAPDQGKRNLIANLTLRWMYNEGVSAGAPFKPLTGMEGLIPDIANMTLEQIEKELVHDSKADWKYSIERWSDRTDRTFYFPFKTGKDGEQTFNYTQLKRFYENNKSFIIEESSSNVGVKAK